VRALVTGAAGFIGSHVARQLCERGDDVRALVLPTDDLRNLAGLDVEVRLGDVTDASSVERAMRGIEVVFHVAALYRLWLPDPRRLFAVNVEGTRTVLAAARAANVRRVVHTSSIARFGGQGRGRCATEESPFALGPTRSDYARSKAEAHEVALRAAAEGQDVVLVAPCGPIGPGDVGPTPTGRLLLGCLSMPVVTVTDTVTNFVDVRDVARGHLLAADRGVRGESYLLGHRNLRLRELAELGLAAGRRLGIRRRFRPRIVEVPGTMSLAAGHALSALADHVTHRPPPLTREAARIAELGLAADASRAVRELGLPQSPLDVAVEDALRWWAREGHYPP
jgi:dihydroflavonol-4-reductase